MTSHENVPSFTPDNDIAAAMAGLADELVTVLSVQLPGLDYSAASIDLLDELCDEFRTGGAAPDDVHGFAILMGAYVGEVLVRGGLGVWARAVTRDTAAGSQEAAAILLPTGLTAFPLTKVTKRLTIGPEHSIAQFFAVSCAGTLPPGTRPMTP